MPRGGRCSRRGLLIGPGAEIVAEPVDNARKSGMTWSQVRDRIDRGETGDKVAVGDPAAAPLGTDAEAGGAITDADEIARSAAAEEAGPTARDLAQRRTVTRPARAVFGLALAALALVCSIAAVALMLAP
jgi:hypothetical protein